MSAAFPAIRILLVLITMLTINASVVGSSCFGTTSNGRLKGGVKLPAKGENFVSYSKIAVFAGRTYVHAAVERIILSAYKSLETEQKSKVYKYAETGYEGGGEFKPHKTHQNGLSVDFMVPVLNKSGKSTHLPTKIFNKLGYDIEFDASGKYDKYTIDYEALAAHIAALHESALAAGVDLWRVIFAPELQPNLLTTKYGPYLEKHIQFSKKRSWVRHDEHYHVDFDVPCT